MTTPGQANAEFTPTTEDAWEAAVSVGVRMTTDEFDRWLARVRREAKAEALRSAALMIPGGDTDECRWWLQSRADRIEAGDPS